MKSVPIIIHKINMIFKKSGVAIFLQTLFFCSLIFAGVNVVDAYKFYPYKWNTNTVNYEEFYLTSTWREPIWDGASQWNAVTPSPFQFQRVNNLNGRSGGSVSFREIDYKEGGTLATAYRVDNGSHLTGFNITFDVRESWTAGPPSSSQMDIVGVAAHEFGHVAGIAHTQWWKCWGDLNDWPTMCSYIPKGTSAYRYFEQDDKDALNALYP